VLFFPRFSMGKKDCAGCSEGFGKKTQPAISCAKCGRAYCKDCGRDQKESYALSLDEGGLEGCDHCSGKLEGEVSNSEDSAGEGSAGEEGCEICQKTSDEEKMLLCDYCDLAFHIFCLDPPLPAIPDDEWFCKACKLDLEKKAQKNQQAAERKRKREEEKAAALLNPPAPAPENKIQKQDEEITTNS